MNISPSGPLLQEILGNVGLPKLASSALGVSATRSDPEQSGVSPQMCRRFRKWPTSCVAERPLLNGAAAVPDVPNAVFRMTTPSVAAGPPGNWAYPSNPPPRVQTQMLRYFLVGHGFTPPVEADLTVSSASNDVSLVW